MLYLCYLCRFKPLRDHLRGFLIAAWAGDKIAEFSFPEISFHFPLRPWFFFVSPAYAGKRRTIPRRRSAAPDHPRVCGEKLYPICSSIDLWGSPPRMRGKAKEEPYRPCHPGITPPHVRGKERSTACNAGAGGITPACAGKSTVRWVCQSPGWDHPRVCGGKDRQSRCTRITPGITPAYAGKSAVEPILSAHARDHPRVCGEKSFCIHSLV